MTTGSQWTGPLQTFTHQADGSATGYSDLGNTLMAQTATLVQNSTTAVTAIVYLPQNAQIVNFLVDTLTQWDSATSATLSIGTAAAGTQYAASINAKTAGRQTPTFTSAQLTAMSNITTNVGVYITVTVVGATTVGTTLVTVTYIQN